MTVAPRTVDGDEQALHGDEILIAVGRRPNRDKVGVERAGIQLTERGAIRIDATMRTTNPRVFAAGDCTPVPQFVYVAAAQGASAPATRSRAPTTSSTTRRSRASRSPTLQIAGVGLTDEQAREEGLDCRCHTLPLDAVPRAQVNLDTRGFAKIVAERDGGRIIGATVVADNAGDVILAAVYAVQFVLTIDDVARTWCPYLTMAEAFKLAAQTFERDVSDSPAAPPRGRHWLSATVVATRQAPWPVTRRARRASSARWGPARSSSGMPRPTSPAAAHAAPGPRG